MHAIRKPPFRKGIKRTKRVEPIILEQLPDVGTRVQRCCINAFVHRVWYFQSELHDAQVYDRDNEAAGRLIRH